MSINISHIHYIIFLLDSIIHMKYFIQAYSPFHKILPKSGLYFGKVLCANIAWRELGNGAPLKTGH